MVSANDNVQPRRTAAAEPGTQAVSHSEPSPRPSTSEDKVEQHGAMRASVYIMDDFGVRIPVRSGEVEILSGVFQRVLAELQAKAANET